MARPTVRGRVDLGNRLVSWEVGEAAASAGRPAVAALPPLPVGLLAPLAAMTARQRIGSMRRPDLLIRVASGVSEDDLGDLPPAGYSEAGGVRRSRWPLDAGGGTLPGHAVVTAVDGPSGCTVELRADAEALCRRLAGTALLAPVLLAGGITMVHGAALTRRGRGLLVVGGGGSGKSTLSLAATTRDWRVVGEDSVFVSAGLDVPPLFPRGRWECRLRPADVAEVAAVTGVESLLNDSGAEADAPGRVIRRLDHLTATPASADGPNGFRFDAVVALRHADEPPTTGAAIVERSVGAVENQATLRLFAQVMRLDFDTFVADTRRIVTDIVTRRPIIDFVVHRRLADDVPRFLDCLDRVGS